MALNSSLLKFQIGPVQDFIAQARSTRDLWSGSYLLSWLVAAGIRALPKGSGLIFPCREGQPLLDEALNPKAPGILIPNLPNLFIAEIPGDIEDTGGTVEKAIRAEWNQIAVAVWEMRVELGLADEQKHRFFSQVDRHLAVSWQITPATSGYRSAYQHNGWHLDAVRQHRDFMAWNSETGSSEKDSLSGKEEAVFHGSGKPNKSDVWHTLLNKHTDRLGAVALVKRVWHLAYLRDKKDLLTESKDFLIRSIPAIAARTQEHDEAALPQEKAPGERYIAAIAFDGDSIGAWLNGDKSPSDTDLRTHHAGFSRALSDFALHRVPGIVSPEGMWLGQLIYAGGDDVVCLVPADEALEIAESLRKAFTETTALTRSKDDRPDASAGIAIAHIHSPLQDLIREAQRAEKRAKNEVGRPAFSIALIKRSGEISHWGSQWDTDGIGLYRAIAAAMNDQDLSARFPHRVCSLLSPYLIAPTPLMKERMAMTDALHSIDTAKNLITREFLHAARRQGSKEIAARLMPPLECHLDGILKARERREVKTRKPTPQTHLQELLTSLIGLCTTVAFAHRNRDTAATPTAEKQPA